jgi:hypothetical protein
MFKKRRNFMDIKERFINYAILPTNSDEHSDTTPSTSKQLVLCELLASELKEAGLSDVRHSGNGYVYAKLAFASPGYCYHERQYFHQISALSLGS